MLNIIPYIEGKAADNFTHLPWHDWFKVWGQASQLTYPHDHPCYELTVRLTDDQEIQCLNGQYRDLDQPTDVLAFASLEDESVPRLLIPEEPIYLGDIIISVDTAQQQSHQRGHSLDLEIAWLTTHGFLHLLGWDHPDEPTLNSMLFCQESLLKMVKLEVDHISFI